MIVVEGDTEYTAFNYIKASKPETYKDIHIIRARGKATIVSIVKILNHFGSGYSVLHDSDRPKITTKEGKEMNNPAWGNNPNILEAVNAKPNGAKVRLLASLPNFECAYFRENAETDKPYNALKKISEDDGTFNLIESLLKSLLHYDEPVPPNCAEWKTIDELEKKLASVVEA